MGIPEGMTLSVAVYGLESAWQGLANEEGTVLGNVTTSGGQSKTKRHMLYKAAF